MKRSSVGPSLLAGLLYLATGYLALELAPMVELSVPLYPAAGVALAAVLVHGTKVLPGIFAAALLLEYLLLRGGGTLTSTLLLSVGIAAAATLQAAVARWFALRYAGYPNRLDTMPSIARLMLVVVPASCLVSATLTQSLLSWQGRVAPEALFDAWWFWWLGDALGMVIVTPMLLALFGQPASDWRGRRLPIVLPMLAAMCLVGAAMQLIARAENNRIRHGVERETVHMRVVLEQRLGATLAALSALSVESTDRDAGERFSRWANDRLAETPGVRALGWAAWVGASQRHGFESAQSALHGHPFVIHEIVQALRGPRPTPVSEPRAYLPVVRVEPWWIHRRMLGLDKFSLPTVGQATDRALRSREPSATAPIDPAWIDGGRDDHSALRSSPSVLVYLAGLAYPTEMPDAESTQVLPPARGFAFAALSPQVVLDALTAEGLHDVQACLIDNSDATRTRLAGPTGCEARPVAGAAARFVITEAMDFAGRDWLLEAYPTPALLAELRSAGPRALAVIGFFTVGLLGIFLLVMTGRTRRVEELVDERTEALRRETTERLVALRALRDSEERLRNVIEAAPAGIAWLDAGGRVASCNARFRALTGYDPNVDAEIRLSDLLDAEHPPPRDSLLADLFGRASGTLTVEHRLSTCDGRSLPVEIALSLQTPGGRGETAIVALVRDITVRKRVEEAERARLQAESANRSKSEFLSRMSHELRTPLDAMLGFSQLLRLDTRRTLDASQLEKIGAIEQAGWHLLAMIDDMLDLSRIEAGKMAIDTRNVDLAALVRDTVPIIAADLARYELRIEQRIDESARWVLVDPVRMRQVLINLLNNACKYNLPQGRIVIEAACASAQQVALRIANTGQQVPAELIPKLFDPFYRGPNQQSRPGTGIGLTLSRHLLQLMSGEIDAASEGEFTVFTVRVPRGTPAG